jgi:hypothetical protein
LVVPVVGRELARDDGRADAISIFHHLELTAALLVVDGRDGEVIDDEHIDPRSSSVPILRQAISRGRTHVGAGLLGVPWGYIQVMDEMSARHRAARRPLHSLHRTCV